MKLRPLTIISAILAAALIILAPAVLQLAVRSSAEAPEPAYTGRLSVWQVAGAAQTNSSLSAAADAFERSHAHVFITITALTPETAAQQLAQGERPDIISCDASFTLPGELIPLSADGMPQPWPKHDEGFLPYAADIYVTYVDDAAENPVPQTVTYTAFRELEAAGDGDYSVTDVLPQTDLVRGACALPSGDELRDAMSAAFCRSLISVSVQKKVIQKNLLPAVYGYETFRPETLIEDGVLSRGYSQLAG